MTKRAMLLAPALCIPQNRKWAPRVLGTGTIIEFLSDGEGPNRTASNSSITACKNELYVQWVDTIGRPSAGWIAARTPWRPMPKSTPLALYTADISPLTPWDQLREILATRGWTMAQWSGSMKGADRQVARQVIRELGGAVPKTADNALLTTILLRVTQAHFKEDQMAKGTKDTATASAPAEAAPKAKAKKEAKAPRKSSMESCAAQCTELGIKHEAIAKMVAGKVSGAALAGLRDHINERATAAREAGKDVRAVKLSGLNRLVRRLQRAA